MNKKQLEKIFDEKYLKLYWNNDEYGCMAIKQFIFENIVPEVLKSVIKDLLKDSMYWEEENNPYWYCDDLDKYIKQKAKELYWIDL